MRIQRSIALLLLASAAAPAFGQRRSDGRYPRHDAAQAFKPVDGGRRLDAFDDRMDRYEAVGKFEADYWKNYGEAWHQWAIAQGYAPSEDSHRAHPEKFNADGTPKDTGAAGAGAEAGAGGDKAEAAAPPMPGPPEFSYWDYLSPEYYREKAAEWEKYAQEQGYLPVLEDLGEGPRDMPRRLDAYDDRMDRYEAVADFEKAYWKAYADGWVQWTQDMGYMPSPESQRVAAAKAAKEAKAAGASRRLDAYDERMDRYEAVGEFEKAYWKAYADGWVQWAQEMGYMPSPDSERVKAAAADKQQLAGPEDDAGYVDVPRRGLDAYDDRMGRYEAVGSNQADYWQRYGDSWVQWAIKQGYMPAPGQQQPEQKQQQQQATGQNQADYWQRYGDSWVQWAIKQGYMPAPGQQQQPGQGEQQPRRLDAYDDRMNRYDAVAQFEADYWKRYGDGWTQWAIKQGYMPAPKPEEAAAKQQRVRDDDGYTDVPRRLDAFDDRMDRYEAVGKFEADYWKRRGEAWQQWAIAQGYAPSEDSHRAHPEKFNADGTPKQQAQPELTLPADAMLGAAGGDKAEAIPGDFYKQDGRSWAQWVADQAFGGFRRFDEDEAAAAGANYPPTEGFAGREGPIAYITEKLAQRSGYGAGAANKLQQAAESAEAALEADGAIRRVKPVAVDAGVVDKAQVMDPYAYDTFAGRATARAVNGMATGAEHVATAAARPFEMAAGGLQDAGAAREAATAATADKQAASPATPATPSVAGGPATPATPASPATPAAAAPKHKNMRGGGGGKK